MGLQQAGRLRRHAVFTHGVCGWPDCSGGRQGWDSLQRLCHVSEVQSHSRQSFSREELTDYRCLHRRCHCEAG